MKICIYAHSFPPIIGGAQTYQYNLALGLGKLGHEVLVLTGEVPESLQGRVAEFESKHFQIQRIAGFREAIKMNSPFRDLLKKTHDIIKDFDPDIIYSNGYTPCLLISLIRDSLRAKHIFSYHSTPEIDVGKTIGMWPGNLELELAVSRFILKQCDFDAYLACSNNYLNLVKDYLNPEVKNAHRIYYGVDLKKFSYSLKVDRKAYGLAQDDIVMLCPVRLIERKGILDILEAVKILKSRYGEKLKLVIPTSSLSTKDKFKTLVSKKIKDFAIEDNVVILADEFLIDDMPKLYAISDIIVFPTYAEGLGIVLLEALAMKKPVVATNIPGVNEVIKDNETGLLVETKNPHNLALAIEKVLEDKSLRDKLIENGYSMIEKEFELDGQVKKVEELFLVTCSEKQ